jgi:glycine/D-amino acid oxidase-like deaminating enzyme
MKMAGVKYCTGAIFTRERASLKPYGLVTALLRILVKEHSLQLHTHSPVTGITPPSRKRGHYTIHTTRGNVRARHIVNATNAWIGHLYPEFRGKINPTRGQVIQVDGKHLDVQPTGWNDGSEYLVQRPDGTLILGGGRRFACSGTGSGAKLTQDLMKLEMQMIQRLILAFHCFSIAFCRGNFPCRPSLETHRLSNRYENGLALWDIRLIFTRM